MSDCTYCPVEKDCYYPYKPTDCVHQRKFWSKERRMDHEPGFHSPNKNKQTKTKLEIVKNIK